MSKSNRKTQATPRLPESDATSQDQGIVIIKTASCPSRSGRSDLTYQLGKDEDLGFHIKIIANTGNGYFNEEWLSIDEIHNRLATHRTSLSASLISTLFEGKSVNTIHFVFAALLSEGFLIKDDQNSRHYRLGDVEGFRARTQALAMTKTSNSRQTASGLMTSDVLTQAKTRSKTKTVLDGLVSESESDTKLNSDDESLLDVLLQSA